MLYLILAILSSTAISTLMRYSDRFIKNNMVMFSANYFVCASLSLLFLLAAGKQELLSLTDGSGFAVLLGMISGVLYLVSFMLLQFNIRKNGVVLSATFMKLGVLVPVAMTVLTGWDRPTPLQVAGCALAVTAIVIINGEHNKEQSGVNSALWLIILLLVGGFTDSLTNIFDKLGRSEVKDQYMLFIFLSAIFVSLLLAVWKKQHFTPVDMLWGALIGIPNYFSTRFLLLALGEVSAIVAYPVYNISAILLISFAGVLFFRERLNQRKTIGIVTILAAITLLNL